MSDLSTYGTPLNSSAISRSADPLADPFDFDDPLSQSIEIQRPPRQTEQPNTFTDTKPVARAGEAKVRFGPPKGRDEARSSNDTQVLRVWHNDNLFMTVDDKNLKDSITSFKSAIIGPLTTAEEVREAVASKLHIEDKDKFKLYAIRNEKKTVVDSQEKVKALLSADSSVKFAFLVDDGQQEAEVRTLVGVSSFSNLAFATFEPLEGDLMTHRRLLNNERYAHLCSCVFHMKTEKVHTLRSVVELRCPLLLEFPQIVKKKKIKKSSGHVTIMVKDDSFVTRSILQRILEFAYADRVEFTRMSVEEVVHLSHAAGMLELPRLVWLCEHYLFTTIGMHNVHQMLKIAHVLQLKSIKNVCVAYAHSNWGEFSAHKGGLEILGLDLFQDLTVQLSQKRESDTSKLQEDAPPSTLLQDYKKLYNDMPFADGTAECSDGQLVPFHRAIVAGHDPSLLQFFLEKINAKRYQFPVTSIAFKHMLQFIYFGSSDLNATSACEIIEKLVQPYGLSKLRDKCDAMVSSSFDIETVLRILMLTYMPINSSRINLTRDLKTSCLNFIADNFAEIAIPQLREGGHTEIAFDLLELLHVRKRGGKRSAVLDNKKKKKVATFA